MSDNTAILLGKIVAAHGIKGDVKVLSFTENPLDIGKYGSLITQQGETISLKVVRQLNATSVLAQVATCHDRNMAETLVGTGLYIHRDQLPELELGNYYHNDLIGLEVFDNQIPIGTVREIYNFGAGDFLEINLPDNKIATIPFTDDAVPVVDIEHGKIIINPDFLLQS